MLLNARNKATEMEAIVAAEQDYLPGSSTHLQASPAEGISCSDHHHRQNILALHTLQLTALETWEVGENKIKDYTHTSQQTSESQRPVSHCVWKRSSGRL